MSIRDGKVESIDLPDYGILLMADRKETVLVTLQVEITTDLAAARKLRYVLSQAETRDILIDNVAERFSRLRGVTGGHYEISGRMWVRGLDKND